MAVRPRDVGVTREEVHQWMKIYHRLSRDPAYTVTPREYLTERLQGKDRDTTMVNTTGSESFADSEPLIDLILNDLDSYV